MPTNAYKLSFPYVCGVDLFPGTTTNSLPVPVGSWLIQSAAITTDKVAAFMLGQVGKVQYTQSQIQQVMAQMVREPQKLEQIVASKEPPRYPWNLTRDFSELDAFVFYGNWHYKTVKGVVEQIPIPFYVTPVDLFVLTIGSVAQSVDDMPPVDPLITLHMQMRNLPWASPGLGELSIFHELHQRAQR